MRGFDNRALILFPKEEYIAAKPMRYKMQLQTAINKLTKYLRSIDIEPHVFYTDDVAREYCRGKATFIRTLILPDLYFTSNYCAGMDDAMTLQSDATFDEEVNEAALKNPLPEKPTQEEWFEVILKRDLTATKKIIPQYKIVVHFAIPNRAKYHVTSKQGDGRIRIIINAINFEPKVLLSGIETDPIDVLGLPCANRTVDNWEV